MVKNIIFDFGAVLVDWNPHYLYDAYFGDADKASWFIGHICTGAWNVRMDAGRSFAEGVAELVAQHPEWEKEIRLYDTGWMRMMGGEVPGMRDLVAELKERGHGLYGLTNWSAEKFALVRQAYPVFSLLDGIVVSGEERLVKPDPRIYRLLLDRYGLRAGECLFIDDNPDNVRGAESVGIPALRFTGPAALRAALGERGLV